MSTYVKSLLFPARSTHLLPLPFGPRLLALLDLLGGAVLCASNGLDAGKSCPLVLKDLEHDAAPLFKLGDTLQVGDGGLERAVGILHGERQRVDLDGGAALDGETAPAVVCVEVEVRGGE